MSACEHGPDFHRCGICTVPRSRLAAVEDELAQAQRERDGFMRRLSAMFPLFEEARDALTAIPLASAKLHNVRLDLADRMDDVGDPARWAERERITSTEERQ